MGVPNIMQIGKSGMMTAKAAIATAGHNVANANTEGFSRQRVVSASNGAEAMGKLDSKIGTGVHIQRVERLNDEYLEKQLRNTGREFAYAEEKEIVLKQAEDIFNEMNGDGLNRLISRFFNEFRKLGNEPDSEAVRQSVREASSALVSDFRRLRREVESVRGHIDAKIEGRCAEVNSLAGEIRDLNVRIKQSEILGSSPNDLLDRRDQTLKKLAELADMSMHKDNEGNYIVDVQGAGPLVAGPTVQKFSVFRTKADTEGKPENAFDVSFSNSPDSRVTHQIKGGKIGALLEARDQTLSMILDRLDELAFSVSGSVNAIHRQGFTRHNVQGVDFFKSLNSKERAAEFIDLSDAVQSSVNNIAAAALPDSPGDNRIAVAISGLQEMRLMNDSKATMDDFYNSIVSDIGVASARARSSATQQKDIYNQLHKIREQLSGVSIDEETTHLLQFQHAFDASARVVQSAEEMMKTILNLGR
jgi:flagellar hook-associated protein 1 FlgK